MINMTNAVSKIYFVGHLAQISPTRVNIKQSSSNRMEMKFMSPKRTGKNLSSLQLNSRYRLKLKNASNNFGKASVVLSMLKSSVNFLTSMRCL